MGEFFNPGNNGFQECINEDIYVDKTGLIGYTNSRLFKRKKYICVSRPRRFGKSYAADMLTAYYGRGCDSHAQFKKCKISKSPDFETHINRYNVIQVSISGYMKSCAHDASVFSILDDLYAKLISDIQEEYPDISPLPVDKFPDISIRSIMRRIFPLCS